MDGDALAQLGALGGVCRALEDVDARYWLYGGWAVDFHAGAVTRRHSDLDLAIWLDDLPRIASRLEREGWMHSPSPDDDGGTAFVRGEVRLELAYLVRDEDGTISTPHRGGRRGRWSEEALGTDVRELNGVRAHVVGLTPLSRSKASPRDDPAEAAKDKADAEVLSRLVAAHPPRDQPTESAKIVGG
ncbi:MAG TPA: hypothetical protein VMT74_00460 [Gaiellaceae bacterium]|nr:hypothetical protein [Gaiellaceae bacterium]